MKKGIHPANYRFVVFKDMSNNETFLSKSSAQSRETIKWEDGNEYPLIKLEISNTSHPFFTGKNMLVDTAGRIDQHVLTGEKRLGSIGNLQFDQGIFVAVFKFYGLTGLRS